VVGLYGLLFGLARGADSILHPPPGRLVDVGGYRLHLHCEGHGSPTVVFDAGQPGWSLDWSLLHSRVGEFTRACTYDRAGYGHSQPSLRVRTSKNMAEELHTLLASAGEDGPFVLVGHDLGAVNARMFHSLHRDDVAGLVLVDPVHEQQFDRLPQSARERELARDRQIERSRRLARLGLLRVGLVFGLEQFAPPHASKLTETARLLYLRQAASSTALDTLAAERLHLAESAQLLKHGPSSLGALPVVVLSAGAVEEDVRDVHRALHGQLAASSRRGTHVVIEDSGHHIQVDRPQAVVEAVREVIRLSSSPEATVATIHPAPRSEAGAGAEPERAGATRDAAAASTTPGKRPVVQRSGRQQRRPRE
jgi:pimeloyl-ACP methyl ester carboxylesterase